MKKKKTAGDVDNNCDTGKVDMAAWARVLLHGTQAWLDPHQRMRQLELISSLFFLNDLPQPKKETQKETGTAKHVHLEWDFFLSVTSYCQPPALTIWIRPVRPMDRGRMGI